MSHYETPEQRRIRELRNEISRLTRQITNQDTSASKLRSEMERIRAAQQKENAALRENLRKEREAAAKQRTDLNAKLRNLDAQVKERERLQNQRIEQMHRRHEEELTALNNHFEEEQNNLHNEIQNTRTEMQQGLTKLRNETDRKIQEQKEETDRSLRALDQKLGDQINAVDQKVRTLAQQIIDKEDGDREIAEYWAQEAARLADQIRSTFKPQLIDRKAQETLERKIRDANSDIRNGQYQTSISGGREAFYDALDLKEELAAAEFRWNYWLNAVTARQSQLLEALDSAENRVYEIKIDNSGEPLTYDNGIDYWTNGQLSIVRNQINELIASLQNVGDMTLEQLMDKEEQLRSLQEQLALVENAAHINVAMSVSRYDMANRIGAILGDQFAMIDSDGEYFACEDREEYHAVYENPATHDQVAVVITPILDEETGLVTNHVELIVGNADNNPVTRNTMVQTVAAQLSQNGVAGCTFPCAGRYGNKTAEEVARVGDMKAVEAGDAKVRATPPVGQAPANNPVPQVIRTTKP